MPADLGRRRQPWLRSRPASRRGDGGDHALEAADDLFLGQAFGGAAFGVGAGAGVPAQPGERDAVEGHPALGRGEGPTIKTMGTRSRQRAERMRVRYAGGRPNEEAKAIHRRFVAGWHPRLLPIAGVLDVPGRRSGATIHVPLVIVPYRGRWYLVSMLGQRANWVANVRAAGGQAVLLHGCRRPVRLVEIPAVQRAPIIRRYLLVAWGARPHMAATMACPAARGRGRGRRIPRVPGGPPPVRPGHHPVGCMAYNQKGTRSKQPACCSGVAGRQASGQVPRRSALIAAAHDESCVVALSWRAYPPDTVARRGSRRVRRQDTGNAAQPGETVSPRVCGGRPWLTGNASLPLSWMQDLFR